MREWTRRLGRLLLVVVEVGLATLVLFSAAILGDIQAGVERGDYNPEAAGIGFVFLLTWLLGALGLAAILSLHAVGWTFWTDRERTERRTAASRLVAELIVAVAIVTIDAGGAVPADVPGFLRVATVVLSVLVLVHVLVNALRFVRSAVTAR